MSLENFAQSKALSIGVELELQIVNTHDYDLSPGSADLLRLVEPLKHPGKVTPEDAGLTRHAITDIRGGDAHHNADALRRLLKGETGAYRDAVLLNAAAALMVAGTVPTLVDGAAKAAAALDTGSADALLARWIAY